MQLDNSWEALFKPGEATSYFDVHGARPFEVDASGYSRANAWWLAEISRLIYRQESDEIGRRAKPPSRKELLSRVRLRESAFINRALAQCSIIESDAPNNRFAVLAFRGTHDLRSWLTNINVQQVRWSNSASVHAGFKEAFDAVWDEIVEHLSRIKEPLYFTGHSLGAALATLAAAAKKPRALYTFGSPRVGNDGFVEAARILRSYRIVNNKDAVARVPLKTMGYRHVGELHYISHNGRILIDPDDADLEVHLLQPDATQAAGSSPGDDMFRALTHAPEPLADHAPVNYVVRLQADLSQIPGDHQHA